MPVDVLVIVAGLVLDILTPSNDIDIGELAAKLVPLTVTVVPTVLTGGSRDSDELLNKKGTVAILELESEAPILCVPAADTGMTMTAVKLPATPDTTFCGLEEI